MFHRLVIAAPLWLSMALMAESAMAQLFGSDNVRGPLYSPFADLQAAQPLVENAPADSPWEGEIEMGINATRGNSRTLSQYSAVQLERPTPGGTLNVDLDYLKATANKQATDHHLLLDIAHRWIEEDERKGWFARFALEYDEFRAFDVRTSVNGGRSILFYDDPDFELHGRVGAGISKEVGSIDDRVVPEAVFSLRAERQLSRRQRVTIGGEYFPEWTSFGDFRLEAEFGWELLLDEKLDMSVKLTAYDRYDSTPLGRKANDLQYAGVLVWKF